MVRSVVGVFRSVVGDLQWPRAGRLIDLLWFLTMVEAGLPGSKTAFDWRRRNTVRLLLAASSVSPPRRPVRDFPHWRWDATARCWPPGSSEPRMIAGRSERWPSAPPAGLGKPRSSLGVGPGPIPSLAGCHWAEFSVGSGPAAAASDDSAGSAGSVGDAGSSPRGRSSPLTIL